MRLLSVSSAVAIFSMLLAGCGTPDEHPTRENEPTRTEAAQEEPSEEATVPTVSIGELVELNEAELTVDSVEEVDSYPTECSDTYSATDGRSLHAIDITVTNTSNDTQYPDGQYIGSEMVTFRDSESREMQFVFPGCKLSGEETFDGLMSGETGSRPLLVEGADVKSQPGWIELAPSFDAEPTVILLDEDLELTRVPE